MHRQSLGSPASKLLVVHGGVVIVGGRDDSAVVTATAESQKIMAMKDQPSPSLSSNYDEEDDEQVRKSIKCLNKSLCRAEKYIHLIPLLTFLCFFILYLSSHNPSDTDLAQFHGLESFSKPLDSGRINDELQRVLEMEKADVLGIRSSRNLQEIDRQHSKYRLHRKIANF